MLLVLAAWRLVTYARSRTQTPQAPALCEACKHEFIPKPGDVTPTCPSCGQKASIRLIYFGCKACGEIFVAYEYDPVEDVAREPGGEWVHSTGFNIMALCPKCESPKLYSVRNPDTPPTDSRRKR